LSKKHDRQFLTMVSLVIGALVGVAVGLFALARDIDSHSSGRRLDDPEYVREVQERTAPVGRVAIAGQDNSALAIIASAAASPVRAPAVSTTVLGGEEVYKGTCAACHATGVGGAPKFGDRGSWAPRLAQGPAVLRQHALAGYQGKAGVMPAKGGRADLPDALVRETVDYLVKSSQ
jgi:cytochrome c5